MTLRIGTRASQLALWQAHAVAHALKGVGHLVELVEIVSEGDRVLDTPLPLFGGKGVFTKALDDALLEGRIDLAVHSHKDLPTATEPGLRIGAVLEREDPRDVLVARDGLGFLHQPDRPATIATGSVRRSGQWRHRHPTHTTVDIRGNVPTRLRKLAESDWDAAIFALAGLRRLGLEHHVALTLDWMVPAPAQGAIAVVVRQGDAPVAQAVSILHHAETAAAVEAERAFLSRLGGGCHAPIGALARIDGDRLHFTGAVLDADGRSRLDVTLDGDAEEAHGLGVAAAINLLARGAGSLLGTP